MTDERDESQHHEPPSWRIRRWAAPIAMAASVAVSIGAVHLLADDPVWSGTPRQGDDRKPRFTLTVGGIRVSDASRESVPTPWFRVQALRPGGQDRLVDSVQPPSSSAGEAQEILAGPEGTFVIASSREKPCESRLYRFRLTGDGRVRDIAPLGKAVTPARIAGLAMSPDGDRIAYTTAPCTHDSQPRASLTVLDIGSGRRRTWSASGPTLIGEIVWADDDRTVGYTISDIRQSGPPGTDVWNLRPDRSAGSDVGNVTVHALDTDAQGTDLRAGRVLFRQPDDAGTVTSAVMTPDGRSGYGVMRKDDPASIVLFSFTEGEPLHVTRTIALDPATTQFVALSSSGDRPHYACLNGVDSFGRVINGDLVASSGILRCGTAYAY